MTDRKIDEMSFKDLYKLALERGLKSPWWDVLENDELKQLEKVSKGLFKNG